MFFYLSKVGWFFLQPSNVLVMLAVAGCLVMLTRLRRAGRTMVIAAMTGIVVAGFSPLGNALILPLEERFAAAQGDGTLSPHGIIVLGGSLVTSISEMRDSVELNEAAERLTAFVTLAERYPEARLVFSGGQGALFAGNATEAQIALRLFAELGLDPDRVEFEDRSRNTWQNAVYSRELINPDESERWLLVTSAWHMPRAVGCFRRAGFPIDAYPVDFRTRGANDLWRPFGTVSEGLRRVDMAVREWVGLAVYRLSGRTDTLLPAP